MIYLQTNTPQVAESPHDRRHVGGGALGVAMARRGSAQVGSRDARMKLKCGDPLKIDEMVSVSDFTFRHRHFLRKHHDISMLTRRVFPCLRASKQVRSLREVSRHGGIQKRFSSTSSTPAATPASGQTSASQLAAFTSELDKLSPRFDVPADSIEILKSPTEFYETLKVRSTYVKPSTPADQTEVDEDQKCQKTRISVDIVYREERA